MGETAELVMPKLGLTMTEGRIARWVVAPGAHFAAGEVVVEIETDKIVSEVEAPSGGTLLELLEAEGTTTPVGTPIARWQPDVGNAAPRTLEKQLSVQSIEQPAQTSTAVELPGPPKPRTNNGRVLATPYARKMAKQVGLDVATIRGTGLGGRIKALDVEHARSQVPAQVSETQQNVALAWQAQEQTSSSGRELSLITIDVDFGILREVERSLSKAAHTTLETRHYVALACIKALTNLEEPNESVPIGFEMDTPAGPHLGTIFAHPRITLSALASEMAEPERRAGQDPLRHNEVGGRRMLILTGNDATHVFGPAVPPGWATAMGVGSVREVFRPGADGSPLLGHEMTLALSYAASELSHAAALDLLARIKALLEEPLSMFVA
jgi:pyruvate dehydrogenase E2 component (dihydrolipoamide acetyltransferase)